MALTEYLNGLTPIAQLPLEWDATGYVSDAFNEEVGSPEFDGWDGDLSSEEEADVIAHLLAVEPGQALLDMACGYGRHALVLARDYGVSVTGVDIAPGLIATAKRLAEEQRDELDGDVELAFEVRHARDIEWRGRFDHAIVAYNTFSVFSPADAGAVLRAIGRALKPGGKLFLDLDNKPFYCRYGSCMRNWYSGVNGVVLQEVFFHHDVSVEVMRDITIRDVDGVPVEFVCLKRIYALDEIAAVLSEAGFRVTTALGNWDLLPHSESSPKIIVVAEAGEQ